MNILGAGFKLRVGHVTVPGCAFLGVGEVARAATCGRWPVSAT